MTNLPEGFKPIEPTADRPAVEMLTYEVFQAKGARIIYAGVVDLAPGSGKERSEVHTFRAHGEPEGQLYGLWRCASLDALLRRVPAGALVFIQYHGKGASESNPEFQEHKWTAARADSGQPAAPRAAQRRPAAFD